MSEDDDGDEISSDEEEIKEGECTFISIDVYKFCLGTKAELTSSHSSLEMENISCILLLFFVVFVFIYGMQ